MTVTDKNHIRLLFFIHRYNKESIAKLYGVSPTRIKNILAEQQNVIAQSGDECLLCNLDTAKEFYIDGDIDNNSPQNKILLCEACRRKLIHMQIRRGDNVLKSLY